MKTRNSLIFWSRGLLSSGMSRRMGGKSYEKAGDGDVGKGRCEGILVQEARWSAGQHGERTGAAEPEIQKDISWLGASLQRGPKGDVSQAGKRADKNEAKDENATRK